MPLRSERHMMRFDHDWPNRQSSRFVTAAGLDWHIQEMGDGSRPAILLVHGTGAAFRSWRDLAPLLARDFRVVAIDLPGHGSTGKPGMRRLSLPAIDVAPAIVAGHSAGAAILDRMCVDGLIAPRSLVSLNGAFLPFKGVAGKVFRPVA